MSFEALLQKAMATIPDCLAGGVSDISTGMLLGVKTVDSHPAEVLELVAAATADLYQGSNVLSIENMFKKSRGVESDEHYFQDMFITSTNLTHVFLRSKSNPDHVATFVCRKTANMGMVMSKARSAMPAIEKAL
ncbi:hypothetical protein FKG94_22295 [Exilibacterium tricleocarpae]|uniref:Roadblock/LC7 domain-containing protein n=1 Tax=Exilibacterium tricleocarpae TaxID=2591008 RepID=A0A545SY38_9GAMM|nr:hypothetical protein [Exilibacterium tricleocarpae]TQV69886.1 hypothetical protein FKG94_22295 [Exilibacterium tricleocarpae]